MVEMPPENSPPPLPRERLAEIGAATRHLPRLKVWERLRQENELDYEQRHQK